MTWISRCRGLAVTSRTEWRDAFKVKWKLNEKTSMFPLRVPGRKRLWLLVLLQQNKQPQPLTAVFRGVVFETSKLLNLAALRAPRLCGPSLGFRFRKS